MEFSKKINKRLTTLILLLISTLILVNILFIAYIANKTSEFTGNAHYTQAVEQLNDFNKILKATTAQVASDERIIELLEKNRASESFDEEDQLLLKKHIALYEDILQPLTFIKTINIVSFQGQYLFSGGTLFDNFDVTTRPWFKDEYLHGLKEPLITNVHEDYTTGMSTISVVKFIYSEDGKNCLGAAILDIFVEDLLTSIDNSFYLGTLTSYLDMGNNEYLSKSGLSTSPQVFNKDLLIYSADTLENKLKLIFTFDKASIIYNRQFRKITQVITAILITIGLILSLTFIRLIRLAFKPIMTSLDKLKILLSNLEKNNFDLELIDEFEQLEFISESLSKSFDQKIQSLIYYDELTALPNRKVLSKECTELIKNQKSFALLFIDLNKFKYINDILGHSAGDAFLISFSRTLENLFNHKGTVTRYSGDEFVIIYDEYTTDHELFDFYTTVVLPEFQKPIFFENSNIVAQFSAGVSVYPRDGTTFDELIKKSDFMMYSSKKNGDTNSLLFFNHAIYNDILKIEAIKLELKNALAKNEFSLYYQPIVGKDQRINKVEALIRWQSEKFGFVSPADFISYAEEIGEIVPIGYWIIEEVCKHFSNFNLVNTDLQISVNVSPIQLMDFDFAKNIKNIAHKYNIDLTKLCFEITESVVLDDNLVVYDNLHLLHQMGAYIALDDFGTGYSSFSYLRKYQLDILKIDRIFVQDTSDKYFNIVKNINDIAHLLDMKVVIEGVETEEQFTKLSAVGCDYFQGYYFSKPITFEQLIILLNNGQPE